MIRCIFIQISILLVWRMDCMADMEMGLALGCDLEVEFLEAKTNSSEHINVKRPTRRLMDFNIQQG